MGSDRPQTASAAPAELVHSPYPDPKGFLRAAVIPIRNEKGVPIASTLVDPHLYSAISRWRWYLNKGGYAARSRNVKGVQEVLLLHRVVMCCTPGDGLIVDHINRSRLDNRRANLRYTTPAQNNKNRDLAALGARLDLTCRNGHTRTSDNTGINAAGRRYCLICRRISERHRQDRHIAANAFYTATASDAHRRSAPGRTRAEAVEIYRRLTRDEGRSRESARRLMGISRRTVGKYESDLRQAGES
jgi:hypothetical protein